MQVMAEQNHMGTLVWLTLFMSDPIEQITPSSPSDNIFLPLQSGNPM